MAKKPRVTRRVRTPEPPASDVDRVKALVEQFAENVQQLRSTQTKEATLRVQYLDRFFKFLGWDVSNENGLPYAEQDVIIEPSIDVAEKDKLRARRPDYLFRIAGQDQLTCEAKKPAVNIDKDKDAIFQAKRDAYSLGLPFAILTDFEQFRVYDTGYQPDIDSPTHGLVKDFSLGYADYPAQWDALLATFGRDAVAGGSLDRLRARVRKTRAGQRIRGIDRTLFELRGDTPAGDAFLAQLEGQRKKIANDLYKQNRSKFPDIDSPRGTARLAEFTQRLIDRVVFCRICEDRGVENYGGLRDLVNESNDQDRPLRDLLVRHFRGYDKDFNGYLFKPHDVETCDFTPAVLRDLVAQFYPPVSSANFAVLPDDLLATVYERFLGSEIKVERGRVDIEPKDAVRHAEGVYYTPKFVVDCILRRVVGPKLAGKKPLDLLGGGLTILDPACGSGSFLIAALGALIDHCERTIAENPKLAAETLPGPVKYGKQTQVRRPIATQQTRVLATDKNGATTKSELVWRLTPDFKGRLLTDCVFGIDIDQQAVEVTIMSLYAKVLNDLPPDWRGISEYRILPALDNNIRCGNSLIDQDRLDRYAEAKHGNLFGGDDNVRFRINAFDWHSETRGFGRILGEAADTARGFDCVIGNPPYIRVQELNQWAPEECAFYKWQYHSAAKGNYDIYVAFTERVLTGGRDGRGLLKPDGAMGFIMPHKWWQAAYGAGLRKIVADGKFLRSVIDFGDQQVFKGATTYTAIHDLALTQPEAHTVNYSKVISLTDGVSQTVALDEGQEPLGTTRFSAPSPSTDKQWFFTAADDQRLIDKIDEGTARLHPDVCDAIFQGIITGADDIFLLHDPDKSANLANSADTVELYSEASHQKVRVEKSILAPVIRRAGFESFTSEASVYLLLSYRRNDERLIDAVTIKRNYPHAWAYLQSHQAALSAREQGRFIETWWQLSRAQNIARWTTSKCMVPYMLDRLVCCYDDKQAFFVNVTTGGYGLNLREQFAPLAMYLCGLLNSRLLDWYLRRRSNHFHGGYFPANKQYIENLPIKLPGTPAEKKLAERIESSVRQIMTEKSALASGKLVGDRDRNDAESRIDTAQRRIDADVMTLYGVDGLPT